MFAFVLLLFVFLATATVAQSAEDRGSTNPLNSAGLCEMVRSSANDPRVEDDASVHAPENENLNAEISEQPVAIRADNLPATDFVKLRLDRQLFETSLVNWRFYEDLAPRQRTMLIRILSSCGVAAPHPALAAAVFGRFSTSQRATFVGVTHALQSTQLVDSEWGTPMGDALRVVEEVVDIQGENASVPSDQQFQIIVRLAPEAAQTLEHAAQFEKGENHVFHKGYPKSFRQSRRIGVHGQEAGLHFCVSRDGRFAQIHIDYRFGLLHLEPANSDVRANGNHQRHVDRWPNFRFTIKRVSVLRVVLP